MLHIIWMTIATLVGWIYGYRVFANGIEHEKILNNKSICHGSLIIAQIVGWDGIGKPFLEWIELYIPEAHTNLHDITMIIIALAMMALWIYHPIYIWSIIFGKPIPKEEAESNEELKKIASESLIGDKVLISKALLAALILESSNVQLKEQTISDSSILMKK